MRLRFSSPLTGPWKKELRTEYILVWSPGARVGHAWLKVEAMNGMGVCESDGRGMESGMFGLAVADVGSGGIERKDDKIPGINRATTCWIDRGFYENGVARMKEHKTRSEEHTSILTQLGGGASAMMCNTKSLTS